MKTVTLLAVASLFAVGVASAASQEKGACSSSGCALTKEQVSLVDSVRLKVKANEKEAKSIMKEAITPSNVNDKTALAIVCATGDEVPAQWNSLKKTAIAVRPGLAKALASYTPGKAGAVAVRKGKGAPIAAVPSPQTTSAPNPLNFPTGGVPQNPVGPFQDSSTGAQGAQTFQGGIFFGMSPVVIPVEVSKP